MARRPVHMKKTALSSRKRAALRASDFAVPSERKYPINDLFHARLALTYVLSPSNAAYRDEVVRAVLTRYPELQFWWAARSKGVEAKRARKAPSTRRKVANPRRNPALDWQTRPVGDGIEYVASAPDVQYVIWRYFPNSGYNIDRDYKNLRSHPLRGQPTLTAAKEEAERDLATLRRKNPRREVETEEYFAAMEPTRAKYAGRSPEELVLVRSGAAKLLRKFAGKSDREVAKALGLDPRDPAVLHQISLMREHPVVTNPKRGAKPASKRSGGRTAAQSNAARAMKLFHSGQASSLAEAWQMVRREETSRSRRDGYQMFSQTLLDADVLGHEPSRFWR